MASVDRRQRASTTRFVVPVRIGGVEVRREGDRGQNGLTKESNTNLRIAKDSSKVIISKKVGKGAYTEFQKRR